MVVGPAQHRRRGECLTWSLAALHCLNGGVAIMGTIVVTVHGTNDGADTDSGDKWWQTDSSFCRKLQAKGGSRGVDLDIRPFHWDGANSDVARRRAGRRLARML